MQQRRFPWLLAAVPLAWRLFSALPALPFVNWLGFGQQLGVDLGAGTAGVAVVLAPSNKLQQVSPFDYALTAVDLATNTSKVIASWIVANSRNIHPVSIVAVNIII